MLGLGLDNYEPSQTRQTPWTPLVSSQASTSSVSAASFNDTFASSLDTLSNFKELGEIIDINPYTNNVEFHGSSSTINFLQLAEREHQPPLINIESVPLSLVSCLHNPATDTDEHECSIRFPFPGSARDYFPEAAKRFLQGYFDGLHYAQPFLIKHAFLQRCQQLWQCGRSSCTTAFLALYFAVLSFGALTMVWRDEELIDGEGRFEWSRRLLEKSRGLAGRLCQTTDLEAVQCFSFLAKVCQNELNPHVAYIYVGRAVRVALTMGLNRNSGQNPSQGSVELRMAQTRTWWAVYSLEIETSFALGRPDSLGEDAYHTRPFPRIRCSSNSNSIDENTMLEAPEVEIIEILVKLARITRGIATKLYSCPAALPLEIQYVRETDFKLNEWLNNIPQLIRPPKNSASAGSLELNRQAPYVRKQRLVLGTSMSRSLSCVAVMPDKLQNITTSECYSTLP